ATLPISLLGWPFRAGRKRERRVASAMSTLGPSYIKLGQFLATRADVIGPELARDLGHLQDRQPPFPEAEARRAVEDALGGRIEDHFSSFGPAIAAASIAQVHKATVRAPDGSERPVAVKILRPGIERQFRRDLDSYYFAAGLVERFHKPSRRLRPLAVVDTLRRTTEIEMDLRLEAAAISEMAENIRTDRDTHGDAFRVPEVDWQRTGQRVMTLEWVEGIPISDHAAIDRAGIDRQALGQVVLRSFLRHAMRDGFFHADMHQGNLLVEPDGTVVAVDFGIMGRLGKIERRFLAEILHGIITRDYTLAAQVHFDAGYVPGHHPVAVFAQAMRAIGEPIHGRTADEISMADLLGQLFAYTEVFDMEARPELIMLQKSMVLVEGVARSLDPNLNIWTAAEPIARDWVETTYGVAGRLKEAGEGAGTLGKVLADLPRLLEQAERSAHAFGEMARDGLRLDAATIRQIAAEEARQTRSGRIALWLAAIALTAIAAVTIFNGLPGGH
ncbi:MAG TPA: 2-polyprenylphenol 6-hydroxylase, partial [Hyphomicrobiaceae bacterium]|nr:2-polyprenylphenol 6-hydroxylase [Hyphomicrobiaceae bacterium]